MIYFQSPLPVLFDIVINFTLTCAANIQYITIFLKQLFLKKFIRRKNKLYFLLFLCIDPNSDIYHIPSAWRSSFNILCSKSATKPFIPVFLSLRKSYLLFLNLVLFHFWRLFSMDIEIWVESYLQHVKNIIPFSICLYVFWWEEWCNFYPWSSVGNVLLAAFKIFLLSLVFRSLNMICLYSFVCLFFYISYLIFSELLESVIWCLLLALKNPLQLLLKIFLQPNCLSLFLRF